MSPRLAAVLSVADFPAAELAALRLDGEVYAVDDCMSPVDELCTPQSRAAALAAQLPPRLIVEQLSAAWVWGALATPPDRHHVCVDIGARTRPSGLHRMVIREVVIDGEDITELAGLALTSPLRTAIDLARFRPHFDDVDGRAVERLMSLGGFSLQDCAQAMDKRRNLPNKKRALARLGRCSGPPGS